METSEFLAESLANLEEDLKETRVQCNQLQSSVSLLDKHLAVLETKITMKAKNESAVVAFVVTVTLQLTSILLANIFGG